jgi:hypothetical protein
MGKVRVVCFHIRSSEDGSPPPPRLSRLRTDRLTPVCKFDYVLAHRDLWGITNLVTLTVTELDDTLPYLQYDIGIVCGPPSDAH